jgi:lyso-ornithine lipid O-acyltransferase
MPSSLRRLPRLCVLAGLCIALMRVPLWLVLPPASRAARFIQRRFFARLNKGLGIRIETCGAAHRQPGTLFIANHVSWADIAVLSARLDAVFIAKSDVARWPVIGALARHAGVIFIDRDRRGTSRNQIDTVFSRIAAGQSVILFPEGTTSDGTAMLPFRPTLLEAASAARIIQPVVIRYLTVAGDRPRPERLREIAWIGDDTLAEGIVRVARERTVAHLDWLEPLAVSAFPDRKVLAKELHRRMAESYAALPSRSR